MPLLVMIMDFLKEEQKKITDQEDKSEKLRKGIITFISVSIILGFLAFSYEYFLVKENKYHGSIKNLKKIEDNIDENKKSK